MRTPPSVVATTTLVQSFPCAGASLLAAASVLFVAASWLQAAVSRARPRPAILRMAFMGCVASLFTCTCDVVRFSQGHRWGLPVEPAISYRYGTLYERR